jgi:hypothetical protein
MVRQSVEERGEVVEDFIIMFRGTATGVHGFLGERCRPNGPLKDRHYFVDCRRMMESLSWATSNGTSG